jgi:hypothetical protein
MQCVLGRALATAALVVALAGAAQAGGTGSDRRSAGLHESNLRHAAAARSRSVAAVDTPGWHGGRFVTATGEQVTVYVSDTFAADQVVPEVWADFFARLPHGGELATVTVRIAPAGEVAAICGDGAAGCYSGGELVFDGEATGGSRPEDTARHEYGHHIAANRANPPWRALDWGPKRWATVEKVCSRVQAATAFPGDEADRYALNPGEAFAEAYRVLAEQKAGITLSSWGIVDGSFYPDSAALSAIDQDVVKPWLASPTTTMRGRFLANGLRRRLLPVATPLDGQLTIELRLPRGRLDTLELLSTGGRVVARGLWAGTSTRRLSYVVCGQRRLSLRVTRAGSPGRFAVTVTGP